MGCKKCSRICRLTDGVGMLTKDAAPTPPSPPPRTPPQFKEGVKKERGS